MKKLICVLLTLFLTLIYPQKIIFAADRTEPPTVNSITGPTSGIVGNTYTFSTITSSNESFLIESVFISQTMNPDTTAGRVQLGSIDAGETGCSTTSCSLSTTFTPDTVGTYYIYVSINIIDTSCNTHPSVSETNCYDSRGKYITFVVSETGGSSQETDLPETGINNIIILIVGISFIMMGLIVNRGFRPRRRVITL